MNFVVNILASSWFRGNKEIGSACSIPWPEYKEVKINSLNLGSSILPNHIQVPFLSNPISPNGGHQTDYRILHAARSWPITTVSIRHSSVVAPDLGNAWTWSFKESRATWYLLSCTRASCCCQLLQFMAHISCTTKPAINCLISILCWLQYML